MDFNFHWLQDYGMCRLIDWLSVCVCVCVGQVSTGEAAHPAVRSMGTWGSKCQLSMSWMVGEDPGGTLGAHTLTCETWYRQPPVMCVSLATPQSLYSGTTRLLV